MDVAAVRLDAHLGSSEARCYLVHGAETLLVEEVRDRLRSHFAGLGFDDVSRYNVESGFDWSALTQASRSLSLFASRRYIEVRLPTAQPGEAGTAFVRDFLDAADPDAALVILTGRLDKKALASAWCRAIAGAGVVVDAGSVPAARLPRWIQQRFSSLGVDCPADVAARLAYYVEGNLLAADQEVRKLVLLLPEGGTLDEERLESAMADHARFNVFVFVDACVGGQAARALRILRSLRREGAEPVMLTWALAREVRLLGQVGAALKAGEPRDAVFRRQRVWSSRAPLVIGALKRLGLSRLNAIVADIAYLDRLVKGQQAAVRGPGDPWIVIERVALALCGIKSVDMPNHSISS